MHYSLIQKASIIIIINYKITQITLRRCLVTHIIAVMLGCSQTWRSQW